MKLRANPVSFVLYSRSDDDTKAFTGIAEKYQDTLRFAVAKNAEMLKVLPEKAKTSIVWFNDAEAEVFTSDAKSLNVADAEKWILERKYPHFVQYDYAAWKHFSSLSKPLVVGVWPGSTSSYAPTVQIFPFHSMILNFPQCGDSYGLTLL